MRPDGGKADAKRIDTETVVWAAGVKASPLGKLLADAVGVTVGRAGHVPVNPDCTVGNRPDVFVVGDLAAARSADAGTPVPGVAQGGIQMGRYAGRIIADEVTGQSRPGERPPFVYHDKGSMATIGR